MIFGMVQNIVEVHVIELLVLLVVVFVETEKVAKRSGVTAPRSV